MNALMKITVRVVNANSGELKRLAGQVDQVAKAGQRAGMTNMAAGLQSMEKFGKNAQWAGRQLEFRFSLPLIAAGAYATKFALENEAATVRIRKVYGDLGMSTEQVNRDVAQLGRVFELLSGIFGVHQVEVRNIAAQWAQAGATGIGLARATRLTLETMVLGQMDAAQATEALIQIQLAYKLSSTQLSDALSVLNAVENTTAATMPDLIMGFQRSANVAAAAGIDIRHLAAMLASMTPAAGTAAQAGNALKTVISRLMVPTKDASEMMSLMGINVYDASWQQKNMTQRLEETAVAYSKLTPNQQAAFNSAAAGRFQINRLGTMFEDMLNPIGQYRRALKDTADQEEANRIRTRELTTQLKSDPQAFKRTMVLLQNAAIKIIIPLLPSILAVAQALARWVDGFSKLNPGLQKFIVFGLVMLAIFGPLLSYMGAFVLLFSQLGKAMLWLAGHPLKRMGESMLGIGNLIGKGLEAPFKKALEAMATRWVRFQTFMALDVGPKIAAAWTQICTFMAKAWAATTAFMARVWAPVQLFLVRAWGLTTAAMVGIWKRVTIVMTAIWQAFGVAVTAIWGAVTAAIETITAAWPVILAAAAVIAVVGLVYIFRKQIGDLTVWLAERFAATWGAIAHGVLAFGKFMARGMASPWVGLVKIVKASIEAIVRMLVAIGPSIKKALSALNPFARHSPSLVESVSLGVDLIARKYASLSGIGAVFRGATAALERFKSTSRGMNDSFNDLEFSKLRGDVGAAEMSGAIPSGSLAAWEDLASTLPGLRAALEAIGREFAAQERVVAQYSARLKELDRTVESLKKQLDRHKETLDKLTDTPIQGMKAYNDAIFENEMAQKRLRLELLRMEEAGQAIDDVKSKLADMQGELEGLLATREDLRLEGAGSDVLAGLDDQINAIETAQRALMGGSTSGATAGIENMTRELERLRLEGERLELEQSVMFDPLTRQIEQATEGMQEMPFDQLLASIKAEQAEVARLTAEYEAASAVRDAVKDQYELEKEKLDELGEAYEGMEQQLNESKGALEEFARQAKSSMEAAEEAVDELSAGMTEFLAGAGNDFEQAFGEGGIFPEAGDLDQLTKDLEEELKRLTGDFDPFGGLKKKFSEFWDDFKTDLRITKDLIKLGWNDLWKDTKEDFRGLWVDFKLWVKGIWRELDWSDMIMSGIPGGQFIDDVWKKLFGGQDDAGKKSEGWFKGVVGKISWSEVLFGIVPGWVGSAWDNLFGGKDKAGKDTEGWFKETLGKVDWIAVIAGVVPGGQILKELLGDIDVQKTVDEKIKPALNGITEHLNWFILPGVQGFKVGWDIAWDEISKKLKDKKDDPIIPSLTEIKDFLELTLGPQLRFFNWVWDTAWTGMSVVLTFLRDTVFTPTWNGLQNAWAGLREALGLLQFIFGLAWQGMSTVLSTIWNVVLRPIWDTMKRIFNEDLPGALGSLRDVWDRLWGAMEGTLKNVWRGIGTVLKKGINFVMSGIRVMRDGVQSLADALHLEITLPAVPEINFDMPGLARGGMVPAQEVGGGWVAAGARAIVGEGSSHPEYVVPTDPAHRGRARGLTMALMQDLGMVPAYGFGDVIGGAAKWVKDKIKLAAGEAMDIVWSRIKPVAESFMRGVNVQPPRATGDKAIELIDGWIQRFKQEQDSAKADQAAQASGGPGGPPPPGDVTAWLQEAIRITGVGQDWLAPLGRLVMHESGGNPHAINNWDSNAKAGTPSKGLLQTIDPTFQANKIPGYDDIWNPVHNAIAAIRYIIGRYGHVLNTPLFKYGSGGYALGGIIPSNIPGMKNGGVVLQRNGGTIIRAGEREDEVVAPLSKLGGGRTIIFYGNLEFPNVRSGEDAEDFLANLETLAD